MKLVWLLLGFSAFGIACSDDPVPLANAGEACSVDSNCASGLVCRQDICVERTTTDMGPDDMTGDMSPDMDTPIVAEEFYISYIVEDLINERQRSLFVLDTQSGTRTKVSPEGFNCDRGCWISDDLTTFYSLRTNTDTPGTFDVISSPVTSLKASDEFTTILVAVRSFRVIENMLTYVKQENGVNNAYFWDGSEKPVGTIGSVEATQGDWLIAPDSAKAITFEATLQTMTVRVGDLGENIGPEAAVHTIDGSNYQEVAGSYFGGNVPSAVSADGKLLAVATSSAPLDTNACTDASQCTGPGERCGIFGRCSSIKVAVHLFDLEQTDNLGERCSGDAACGPIHVCDIPSDTQLDQAVCIPRPVVLGLPGQQTQGNPARPGCELTAGNDDLFYTSLRSPLNFGSDGNLYFAADRDCNDLNIAAAGVIKIEPTTGNIETVYGNRNENFDFNRCYDEVEQVTNVEDCVVFVESAVLSPGGNKIAFLATNPEVIDYALAESTLDIWLMDRDGQNYQWIGNHGSLEAVQSIRVHPKP